METKGRGMLLAGGLVLVLLLILGAVFLTNAGPLGGQEESGAARQLRQQLNDASVSEVSLDGDVTLQEPLTVTGKKTLTGSGTLTLAKGALAGVYQDPAVLADERELPADLWEAMPGSGILCVGPGGELTLSGQVVLDGEGRANPLTVASGASASLESGATLTGGRLCDVYNEGSLVLNGGTLEGTGGYCAVNLGSMAVLEGTVNAADAGTGIYSRGRLEMSGGAVQDAARYGVFLASGGELSLTGGSLTNAGEANLFVDTGASGTVRQGAAVSGGGAGIVNYGILDLDGAQIERNIVNLKNYGQAQVKSASLTDSVTGNVENYAQASLTLTGSNLTGSGTVGLMNDRGSVSFTELQVRRSGAQAVCNMGGTLEGKELTVFGSGATALDNMDTPDGIGGDVTVDGLEIQNSTAMNVNQESLGSMSLRDAVFGLTSVTNVKLTSGSLSLSDFEISGTTATGAGVWATGGALQVRDGLIKETKGRGLALAGGKVTGGDLRFENIVNTGIEVMVHDNGYSSADVTLENVSFQGGKRDNVACTTAQAKLTINGGTFGKTLGNNTRCTAGSMTLNNVQILGNEWAPGQSTNYHGVYSTGGTVSLNGCSISGVLACAIRNKGAELFASNLRCYGTPQCAITNAYRDNSTVSGNITINGLEVTGSQLGALKNECAGKMTVSNATLGEGPGNIVHLKSGSMALTNVDIGGSVMTGTANYHNVYVVTGSLTLDNVKMTDSDASGIRQAGGTVTGKNVNIRKTAANNISISGGSLTLTDSVLEISPRTNVNLTGAGATVTLIGTLVNGAGDSAGNNVNCVYIAPNATANLLEGTVLTGSVTRAGVASEGGKLNIDGAEIYGNGTRGITLQVKTETDKTTGETTTYLPTAVIKNAYIHDNGNETVTGGAIYNEGGLELEDSVLRGNRSTSGGAMNVGSGSTSSLKNVTIENNSCTGNGGGIHASGGSYVTIQGGVISGNKAGGNGDGIRMNGTQLVLAGQAVIDPDNDVYLEEGKTIQAQGDAIGNTANEPLQITAVNTNIGTVLIDCEDADLAAAMAGKTVCQDRNGADVPVSVFETDVVVGAEGQVDFVARIPDGSGKYSYYTTLADAFKAVPTTGEQTRVELLKDVTLDAALDIPENGNRNILFTDDGNGPHTVTRGAGLTGRMIILRKGNALTLQGFSGSDGDPSLILDGGGVPAGKDQQIITVGTSTANFDATMTLNAGVKLTNNNNSSGGGAIIVHGTLTMNGGLISGNESADNGGAIFVHVTGKVLMTGGTITGNSTDKTGGGVYLYDTSAGAGSMEMSGGEISGNTSAKEGGGITVLGKARLELSGGKIINNSSGEAGGGVFLNYAESGAGGTMNMTGGLISGNKADKASGSVNGGGVFVHAKAVLNMSGGAISENSADGSGGGVYLHYNATNGTGTLNMSGGSIKDNTAGANGGGVYICQNAALAMTGGEITDNKPAGNGRDVYDLGVLRMSGQAVLGSAYLGSGVMVELSGALDSGEQVTELVLDTYTVGRQVLTGNAAVVAGSYHRFAVPENSGTEIDENGKLAKGAVPAVNEARVEKADGTRTEYPTLEAALKAVPTDNTSTKVVLLKDVTLTRSLDIDGSGKNILLTDDGTARTIHRGTATGRMIILRKGNTLTLQGSSGSDENPTLILDGDAVPAGTDQQIITVGTSTANFDATMTLNAGVKLTNNKNSSGGGAIIVHGTLTMNGGLISGNETTSTGGAIYIQTTGNVIMNGGEISGNKSTKEGGGIVVQGTARLELSGGKIINNSSGEAAGGIFLNYANGAGGTLDMTGGSISGNRAQGGSVNGGGVFAHAKAVLNMSGGEISGNSASGSGGGVYLHYNATNGTGTLNMSGGSIKGNTAGANGGGVYICQNASLAMTGGEITDNTPAGNGKDVYDLGVLRMSGQAVLGSAYLGAGMTVELSGPLDSGEQVTELVLDDYPAERQVLTGDPAVVTENYQRFAVPEDSGMEIGENGQLAASPAAAAALLEDPEPVETGPEEDQTTDPETGEGGDNSPEAGEGEGDSQETGEDGTGKNEIAGPETGADGDEPSQPGEGETPPPAPGGEQEESEPAGTGATEDPDAGGLTGGDALDQQEE